MQSTSHSAPFRLDVPFRADIEGLRAIAVLLVLVYHAGVTFFGGGYVGVDVFFVLSGYLITGLLVRELDATGTIQLLDFYAKRARRLLPASFAVLTAVALLVFAAPRLIPDLIAPQLYGRAISWDIQRSALYVVNWLFAERSVDYQGGTELASPLQHFWSLSVEEQFYAVWPMLLLGITAVTRSSKRILGVCLVAVTAASLVMSYRLTRDVPEQAYFVTTTRVWEMSLGGLAALFAPVLDGWIRAAVVLPETKARLATAGTVIGLATIVSAAIIYDHTTPYPGLAALLPTLGTAAVLLAAPHSPSIVVRAISSSPMRWIGARSYSLYLWHWPMLWLVIAVEGELSTANSLAVVALSVIPAMASYRWIEQPSRSATFLVSKPLRGVALTGGTAIAGYALGFLLLSTTTNVPPNVAEIVAPEISTEVAGIQLDAPEMLPSVANARFDVPAGYENGCIADRDAAIQDPCSYGNSDSDTTVLVLGNSHAGHWTPAFVELARRYDWHLLTNIRSSCRLTLPMAGDGNCAEWAAQTLDGLPEYVENGGIDLVVTMPTAVVETGYSDSGVFEMYETVFKSFGDIGTPAVIIHPTPRGKVIGIDCPSLVRGDLGECASSIDDAFAGTESIVRAARTSSLPVIDMTRFFCTDDLCPAVIDDVLVRRDRHHITRTFAVALTNPLATQLEAAVPQLFPKTD